MQQNWVEEYNDIFLIKKKILFYEYKKSVLNTKSVCLFVNLPIFPPFMYLSVWLSVRPSVSLSFRLSVFLSVCLSVFSSDFPSVFPFVFQPVFRSVSQSVFRSAFPSVCLFIYPSLCVSVRVYYLCIKVPGGGGEGVGGEVEGGAGGVPLV